MATLRKVERLQLVIHGRVQGVGFRYFLFRRASALGIKGWVRNNDDGTVELMAEGGRADLELLREAAERGPGGARVERVDVAWSEATGGLGAFDLNF